MRTSPTSSAITARTARRSHCGGRSSTGTFRQPVLRACSQAGLVNNLNDALAWGLAPLYLAANGASTREIGIVAAVYPALWGAGQLVDRLALRSHRAEAVDRARHARAVCGSGRPRSGRRRPSRPPSGRPLFSVSAPRSCTRRSSPRCPMPCSRGIAPRPSASIASGVMPASRSVRCSPVSSPMRRARARRSRSSPRSPPRADCSSPRLHGVRRQLRLVEMRG